jgi:myosin-crossreactive antigen
MSTLYKSHHKSIEATGNEHRKAYLVGAGIASLASAAYLIKDGHFTGSNIFIIGESGEMGGRMFDDEAYTCTYDLLSFIPSLTDPAKSVKEVMFEFIEDHSITRPLVDWLKGQGVQFKMDRRVEDLTFNEEDGEKTVERIAYTYEGKTDVVTVLPEDLVFVTIGSFITSQFLVKAKGDRPQIVPARSANLALIGQYCETPGDVVFTVEYSVRAAQIAVKTLLGLDMAVSPLYKGQHDLGLLVTSMPFTAMVDGRDAHPSAQVR